MEKLEVDSKSGSEEEFFDCLGKAYYFFLPYIYIYSIKIIFFFEFMTFIPINKNPRVFFSIFFADFFFSFEISEILTICLSLNFKEPKHFFKGLQISHRHCKTITQLDINEVDFSKRFNFF